MNKVYKYIFLFFLIFFLSFYFLLEKNNEQVIYHHQYNKKEVSLIYIGNSKCMFCSDPELKSEINKVSDLVSDFLSNKSNVGFKKIGISIDVDPHEGYMHLKNMISFNEVITGNGWGNLGSLTYVYSDEFDLRPATPQILFVFREFNEITNVTTTYRGVKSEKILLSLTGLHEIREFNLNDLQINFNE